MAAGSALPGLLGSVAAVLNVQPGAEAALATALGVISDAAAVSGVADAIAALELLRNTDGGRAGLLVGGAPQTIDRSQWPTLPTGVSWAIDLVTARIPSIC